MGGLQLFCPSQEARSSITDEKIQRGFKKRDLDKVRKPYMQEEGYDVLEV